MSGISGGINFSTAMIFFNCTKSSLEGGVPIFSIGTEGVSSFAQAKKLAKILHPEDADPLRETSAGKQE